MATYLIVPVLVIESEGVTDSIKRSASLLRKTWGEQILGWVGFGWVGLALAIPGVILGAAAMNYYPWLIPLVVLYFVVGMAAFTAMREIFVVALYRYATVGESPAGIRVPERQ
jgi:hypothetical protein